MSKKTKKYYAVAVGRKPGIYEKWFGEGGAEIQVRGFPKARFKGFATFDEAGAFLKAPPGIRKGPKSVAGAPKAKASGTRHHKGSGIVIYTDGGCFNNPGPGGYGAVIIEGKKRKELSGGFRRTTNNRMELTACIVGLGCFKTASAVTLYSDSKYVVDGISKGWARRWRLNNWMRTKTDPAVNPDLWGQLLDLCEKHTVTFCWVKGHAGNPENERCDQLCKTEASKENLPIDTGYERK
jgi:ribonuclease HI